MARPVDFPEADARPGFTSGDPRPLPVRMLPHSSVSCWELDDAELEEIRRTRRIWIQTSTFGEANTPLDPGEVIQPAMTVTTAKEEAMIPGRPPRHRDR